MNVLFVSRHSPSSIALLHYVWQKHVDLLLNLLQKGTSQKVRRAQILLKADADGPAWTDAQIADAFSCRTKTVENVRQRFVVGIPSAADPKGEISRVIIGFGERYGRAGKQQYQEAINPGLGGRWRDDLLSFVRLNRGGPILPD